MKRSILLDSGADILSYGMGEHSIVEIAEALDSGIAVRDITFIRGTVYRAKSTEDLYDFIQLPSYPEIVENKKTYAESFYKQYCNTDPFSAKTLVEQYKEKRVYSAESAGNATVSGGDGCCLCTTLYENISSGL